MSILLDSIMIPEEMVTAPTSSNEAPSALSFAEMWHISLTDPTSPHAQSVLHLQERAIASVGSGITIADLSQPDCPIIYCNTAFTTVTGYTPEEVLGYNCRFLQGPDTDPKAVAILRHAIKYGLECTVTFKNYRKDLTPFWNELTLKPIHDSTGRLTHFIGVQHDVTTRKEAEDALARANEELEAQVQARTAELERVNTQLRHDAFHDGLTDLANRALFRDHLVHALEREKRNTKNGFAVLYLDFDRFKVINDSLGHTVGDQLLVAIAKRLSGVVRPGDTVARLGGDEFALLLEDLADLREATCIAERIHASFSRPFILEQHEVHISASIGVVTSLFSYNDAGEILRDVDIAMYRAKALGKSRHVMFDVSMRERALGLIALEADLRQALVQGEFSVHYQPIIAAQTGQSVGFEALVRWQHPRHGAISPAEFIPLAEETGLIIELDRWVMREGCAQVAAWQAQFPEQRRLHLSVNLSSQQFLRADLVTQVEAILCETGLSAKNLCLELTETVVMDPSAAAQHNIAQLKALGIQLHIDDFGTGYSSLSYLHNLPSDTLKIDRSFINRLTKTRESGELVRTIIVMAHNLGMKVVAEGVETSEQLALLTEMGCEYVQGYLLAKPLDAAGAAEFMFLEQT